MKETAIKVENLSKAYQIGQIGTGTISRDLERFWTTKVLRKEDPFLRIGEANDRSVKGESDIVWSLKDLNFEINQGEAVGIIGKNGAGKSTLLKLLSRVTSPTTGEIKIKGRIASLLEVGTGFHPELSGRENIYLNGAILGMRKKEITRKLDEIIEFSGVQRYIDTPVKRYSSGMYVRLAFAVAAHLESEILIVDEVLAVGDAEFQKKCLGKMGDISKSEGRTVLFVSHNMAAVKNLCSKAIVLNNGKIAFNGDVEEGIDFYSEIFSQGFTSKPVHKDYQKKLTIVSSEVFANNKIANSGITILLGNRIKIQLELLIKDYVDDLSIAIDILDKHGELMSHLTNEDDGFYMHRLKNNDVKKIEIQTSELLLIPGTYSMNLWFGISQHESLYAITNFFSFTIEQSDYTKRTKSLPAHSKMYLHSKWNSSDTL